MSAIETAPTASRARATGSPQIRRLLREPSAVIGATIILFFVVLAVRVGFVVVFFAVLLVSLVVLTTGRFVVEVALVGVLFAFVFAVDATVFAFVVVFVAGVSLAARTCRIALVCSARVIRNS